MRREKEKRSDITCSIETEMLCIELYDVYWDLFRCFSMFFQICWPYQAKPCQIRAFEKNSFYFSFSFTLILSVLSLFSSPSNHLNFNICTSVIMSTVCYFYHTKLFCQLGLFRPLILVYHFVSSQNLSPPSLSHSLFRFLCPPSRII